MRLAALFAALALVGAAAWAQKAPAINVSAVVSGGSAHLSIRFSREGEDVRVIVRGEGGLVVQGDAEPIKGRSVGRGEKIALDVAFERGPDRSALVVEVSGKFDGQVRTVSQTVRVGTPSDEQRHQDRERMTAPIRGVPLER